jgi:hypothetical protein
LGDDRNFNAKMNDAIGIKYKRFAVF